MSIQLDTVLFTKLILVTIDLKTLNVAIKSPAQKGRFTLSNKNITKAPMQIILTKLCSNKHNTYYQMTILAINNNGKSSHH